VTASSLSIFHCSDLHFGHPAVPEQYEAIETLIQDSKFDVVVISGDLTQRARSGEFQRARAFIRHAERVSRVVVVPGNHDVAWWLSPFGMGDDRKLLHKYRRYIDADIEPTLRIPGATFVGLNTCHGVIYETLTWMHHNPVQGELSRRHGLRNTNQVLGAFREMGVDLVCCGHDHQEAVHYIEHTKKGTIISTAGTISNRARGGRPSSVNSIRLSARDIDVHTLVWSQPARAFGPGPQRLFPR
jgi:predicted phosphodiesterase